MDFSLRTYDRLLGTVVGAGYRVLTLRRAIREAAVEFPFILRHDVEWNLKRTLAVTDIEKRHNIRSSLYFRVDTRVYDLPTMARLQEEGFEIGYHFNTLDRCRGDFAAAIALFEREVQQLRDAGLTIDTVIQHGDPRVKKTGYLTNGDILIHDPGLLARNGILDVATGLDERYPNHIYVRDLGVRWDKAESGRQLVEYIRNKRWPAIYMLTHPDYWSESFIRACGLQVAARILRGLSLNRKIAAIKSWCAPRPSGQHPHS
jgi:hypothetical protein